MDGYGKYGMARHATPRHALACAMPSHPEGHRRSMKSPSPSYLAKQRSPKRKFRTVHSFLHIPIILFFPPFLFLVLPNTVPCRRVVPDWDWLNLYAFIYQPLIGLAICSVPVPASLLFFHGRYISLPSSTFPSLPRHEPPVSTLRSPQHRRLLSFMATFPHNHSSLVFKTSPSLDDHITTHHVLTTPVSVQGQGLSVSFPPSPLPFVTYASCLQYLLSPPSTHRNNPRSRQLWFLHSTRRALPYPMQPALPWDRSLPLPHPTMYHPKNTSRAGSATLVRILLSTPLRTLAK